MRCPRAVTDAAPFERVAALRIGRLALLTAAIALLAGGLLQGALPVEDLRSIAALPPHIAATFREAAGFRQITSGDYLVFDRRGHTVFRVDKGRATVSKVVQVGHESGQILQPVAFAVSPDDNFIVADAPAGRERVQRFTHDGTRLGGFALPGRASVTVRLDNFVLNGVGSLQYDRESIYVNLPETGSLITEYSLEGAARRSIGNLRATGFEADRQLHAAFNTGLPLVNPRGGFYFVFQAGQPRFRKYDANGTLLFEREVQGRELDPLIATQATTWESRRGERQVPAVRPLVRTAAVDAEGRLWISLTVPVTYVYDEDGDKVRVVQFRAAGIVQPNSLAFTGDGLLLVTPGCYVFDPRHGTNAR